VPDGKQELPSDADPAQVAFTPDGSMVVITTRGTDSIMMCEVHLHGPQEARDRSRRGA
jgi:hypothetical protein